MADGKGFEGECAKLANLLTIYSSKSTFSFAAYCHCWLFHLFISLHFDPHHLHLYESKFHIRRITLLKMLKINISLDWIQYNFQLLESHTNDYASFGIWNGLQQYLVFSMQICVLQTNSSHHQQSNQNACFPFAIPERFCWIIKWNGIRPKIRYLFFSFLQLKKHWNALKASHSIFKFNVHSKIWSAFSPVLCIHIYQWIVHWLIEMGVKNNEIWLVNAIVCMYVRHCHEKRFKPLNCMKSFNVAIFFCVCCLFLNFIEFEQKLNHMYCIIIIVMAQRTEIFLSSRRHSI